MNQKKLTTKALIGYSLLFNILLLIACILMHPISETGDDSVMMSMASGCFGEPVAHLVYINILLGYCFKILYMYCPVVNWYYWIQVSLLFCSFTTLTYLLLKKVFSRINLIIIPTIMLPLAYFGYITMQYTITSGVLTCIGCTFLNECIKNDSKKRIWIWGFFLVFGGIVYRFFMSFACMAVFWGIILGSRLMKGLLNRETKVYFTSRIKKYIPIFIVCLAGLIALRGVNNYFYHQTGWSEYSEYNYYRGQVRDFPILAYDENEEQYLDIGVSRLDYANLLNWNIADPEYYTVDRLKNIYEMDSDQNKYHLYFSWGSFRDFLGKDFLENKAFYIFLVSLLLIILLSKKDSGDTKVELIIAFIVLFAVEFFMYLRGRYGQPRVYLCIFYATLFGFLSCNIDSENTKIVSSAHKEDVLIFRNKTVMVFTMIIVMVLFLAYLNIHFNKWGNEQEKQAKYAELMDYIDSNKDKLFFINTTTSFYGYGIDWFETYDKDYCNNAIWLGGWYTNSPPVLNFWGTKGINNPFKDMVGRNNAYIVGDTRCVSIIVRYINQHYDENFYLDQPFYVNDYSIFKVHVDD